jgi:hypothetical protein
MSNAKYLKSVFQNQKVRRLSENLNVRRELGILNELCMVMWTGFLWLRICLSREPLWTHNQLSVPIKSGELLE